MKTTSRNFLEYWFGVWNTPKETWASYTRAQWWKIIRFGFTVTSAVLFVEGIKLALWVFAAIGVYHTFWG